jgi:alpha-L-fucosidase
MRFFLFIYILTGITEIHAQPNAPTPYGVLPTSRQIKWHEMDMYVLVHFTPTTFENKEWGYGDADPAIFNPKEFDAGRIVNAIKAGGFKGMILVAKHHDGFCLWPTKTTPYNISKSPWRNGKGDMVKEFEQACRKDGLEFGIYCSPWDRNNPLYGTPEYVKIYRAQLKELYTGYGNLFMSWHDGANGGDGYYGGKKENRTIDRSIYYGWDTTWAMTRKLQPSANIFSDMGWDIRWVGNEKGEASETSWTTFTPIPEDGKAKVGPGDMKYDYSPTGTRNGKYWMPAECDVPLRSGWFYHPDQDDKVKSASQLFDLYLKSVGRGGGLDLGIAPDTRGLLNQNDINSLAAFGRLLSESFKQDLSKRAKITVSNTRSSSTSAFTAAMLNDGDRFSYWSTDENIPNPEIILEWEQVQEFDLLRIRENIKLGQRVEAFSVDVWSEDKWSQIAEASSIGNARILYFPVQKTLKLRIRITKSPVVPAISEVGIFKKSHTE